MPYVITNGSEYIMKNSSGKYVTIRNAAMADEFNKNIAEKILNSSIPKKIREGMYIEKIDDGKKRDLPEIDMHTDINFNIPNDVQSLVNKIEELSCLAEEAEKRKEELNIMLSEVDRKISDLSHYVEFSNLNACQGYKVAKKWHDLRCDRRKIKNEIQVITLILNNTIKSSVSKKVDKLIENINKRQYEPRELKELFDI